MILYDDVGWSLVRMRVDICKLTAPDPKRPHTVCQICFSSQRFWRDGRIKISFGIVGFFIFAFFTSTCNGIYEHIKTNCRPLYTCTVFTEPILHLLYFPGWQSEGVVIARLLRSTTPTRGQTFGNSYWFQQKNCCRKWKTQKSEDSVVFFFIGKNSKKRERVNFDSSKARKY